MSAHMVEHELIDVLVTAALHGPEGATQHTPLSWAAVPIDPYQAAIPGDWWGEFHRAGLLWSEHADRVTTDTTTQVGRMLLAENGASVCYRYARPDGTPDPRDLADAKGVIDTYRFRRTTPQAPVVVLRAISSFTYQACEHPTWGSSAARSFTLALTKHVIEALPGYFDAPCVFDAGTPGLYPKAPINS